MACKLREIAALVGGEVVGDGDVSIERVAPIETAQPGDITFISNPRYVSSPKYVSMAATTKASALLVSPQFRDLPRNLVVTENPYLAFARCLGALMDARPPRVAGVHPTAVVAPGAELGADVSIGPHAVVEDEAEIGDGATLMAGVFAGHGVSVGEGTTIHPNCSIYHGTRIGRRCVIHANVVLGSDGFGWAPDGRRYERIPQVGITVVGDDVSIGAGTIVNRGGLGNTTIGRGTKIDSLVVISHNVEIGEDCLLVSQVGVSGTVKIGDHVSFGGQVGVVGHVKIGDNVVVGAQSGVTRDLAPNQAYLGSPARPGGEQKRMYAAQHALPGLRDELRKLQRRVAEIDALLARDAEESL